MILVNQQLKEGRFGKTHREMFPRLYHQSFGGKWELLSHISVKIIDENIDVQTDLNDVEVIREYVTEWIKREKIVAKQKLQEAQNTLKIINKVL